MEWTTAEREQLRLAAVIVQDGSYGAEHTKSDEAAFNPMHSLIQWPEFAYVARARRAWNRFRTKTDLNRAAAMAQKGRVHLLIGLKADAAVDIGMLS